VAALALTLLSSANDLVHCLAVLLPKIERIHQKLECFLCFRCVVRTSLQTLNRQSLVGDPLVSLSNVPIGDSQVIALFRQVHHPNPFDREPRDWNSRKSPEFVGWQVKRSRTGKPEPH